MDILSGKEIRGLMRKQLGICVSIYMPTIRKGTEIQQNQIRYKNMLRSAEDSLLSSGDLRPSEIKDMLAPAQELHGNVSFWQGQSYGLALFISSDFFKCYRLPERFEELVVVTDRFHVKPLIPVLVSDAEFSILAISQKDVRLLKCTLQRVKEVDIEGVPGSLDEALNLDDFEKHLQRHTGTEDMKPKILQYFKLIDKGLRENLRDRKSPLIFAGVDYLFHIYREANSYPHLSERWISGNPEGFSADRLSEMGWTIAEDFLNTKKVDALAQYSQNAGTGLTSIDIEEIVREAHNGRVAVLFFVPSIQRWGKFDSATGKVALAGEAGVGNEDMLDLAAIQTILNGGVAYPIEKDETGSSIAAIFRY